MAERAVMWEAASGSGVGGGCGAGGVAPAGTMNSITGSPTWDPWPLSPWFWDPVSSFEDPGLTDLDHIWAGLSLGDAYPHQGCTAPPQWDPGQDWSHREWKSFPIGPMAGGWMSWGQLALLPFTLPETAWHSELIGCTLPHPF